MFSAGNSGPNPSTLTAPKEAKNLIVLASSRNYWAGSIDAILSFSSRGPAVDGRIMPTITTPGEQIASSRNDPGGNCATPIAGTSNLCAFRFGTNIAAPHTSGAIGANPALVNNRNLSVINGANTYRGNVFAGG